MTNTKRPSLKYSFKGTLITNARSGDLKYKYAPLKNLITKDKNEKIIFIYRIIGTKLCF